MLHSLWPTKIAVINTDFTADENAELADIAERFSSESMNRSSLFKWAIPRNILIHDKSPVVKKFYGRIQALLDEYLKSAFDIDRSGISNLRFNTWGNVERSPEWSIPHGHYANQVVITYYPHVYRHPEEPDRAGHLVFHNPKPLIPAFMIRKEHPLYIVRLQSGTMLAFPGNAQHSTFPFFRPESKKVALVTNIRFGSAEEPPEHETYRSEADILAAQGAA